MKRTIAAIALFVASTFITAGVMAQDHQVKATVPFNFTVNNTAMPAGKYTIGTDVNSPNVLRMRDREQNAAVMTIGLADPISSDNDHELIFHRYGNQYFLSEVRCSNASLDLHLPTSKAEKQARKQIEEAGVRVNNDVLIALK